MKRYFNEFTNKYALSKTLMFELKPVGKTQQMLEENKVFAVDWAIQDKYKRTRPYINRLHRKFIRESLSGISFIALDEYWDKLRAVKAITRETSSSRKKVLHKALEKEEKRLRKQVVSQFDATAKDWVENKYKDIKFSKKNHNILFEKNGEKVFALLKKLYGHEDDTVIESTHVNPETGKIEKKKISIFDSWKGFSGYFEKFFKTRENFYQDDGKASAIATRVIDENLRRFCENMQDFAKIKEVVDCSVVEENFEIKLTNIFSLDFYNKCAAQTGIDIYNKVLGGQTLKSGEKLNGINELINKYRQDHKGEKLPFLKTLDRQILSGEDSDLFDEISDDEQLIETVRALLKTAEKKVTILKKLFDLFVSSNNNFDLEKVYFSKKGFEQISRKWTHETKLFEKMLYETMKSDKVSGTRYKKAEDKYEFPDFIALQYIKTTLQSLTDELKSVFWKKKFQKVVDYGDEIWKQFLQIFFNEFKELLQRKKRDNQIEDTILIGYKHSYKKLSNILNSYNFETKLTKAEKVAIKDFADELLHIYQFSKYFAVEKKRKWLTQYELDTGFYEDTDIGYRSVYYQDAYETIIKSYNKLRNYLTKKPWEDVQKWKLNFGNASLGKGWDKNKEKDNTSIILRKDGKYFLGLMEKGSPNLFTDKNKEQFSGTGYKKMVYKLLPGPSKMLPKVFFSKSKIGFFDPSEEVLKIRNYASHTKSGTPQKGYEKKEFNLSDCHVLIDFFKQSLNKHSDWKNFDFDFSETSIYKDISAFYRDVEKGGYKLIFEDVSERYIQEKNNTGELYLFQIKNKDWNEGVIGTKNLHTLYFEHLFSQENANNNFILKLNGEAEIFYRPKVSANDLGYKKDKQGKQVVNHKRYNRNQIFFHVPITLNRFSSGRPKILNRDVNEFLAHNPEVNIIGIDRGEKHIAYYSVIDQDGKILQDNEGQPVSGTLNHIVNYDRDGSPIMKQEKEIVPVLNDKSEICDYKLKAIGKMVPYTDYKLLLEYKEKKRKIQRQSWQFVEGIKDLKRGYLSQVVKKLADLAIEYNAIIVLEDLNMRFKQIRGGIERSVYQQFEKTLIDKLSFLVDKGEKDSNNAGHVLKAYQLATPIESFKKMGKQVGIIFYTTASYTSKIDPLTGWRKQIYLKSSSAKVNKETMLKFSNIVFNHGKDRFDFTYSLENMANIKNLPHKTVWTVSSCVERFRWNRELNENKGGYDHYENLTENFKKLFVDFNVDINGNIKQQIKDIDESVHKNKKFFRDFIFLFNLICQIRNTNPEEHGDKNDFILSPVEPFFDSRQNNGKLLPKNGDDNGAFNIARKGIITLNKINE